MVYPSSGMDQPGQPSAVLPFGLPIKGFRAGDVIAFSRAYPYGTETYTPAWDQGNQQLTIWVTNSLHPGTTAPLAMFTLQGTYGPNDFQVTYYGGSARTAQVDIITTNNSPRTRNGGSIMAGEANIVIAPVADYQDVLQTMAAIDQALPDEDGVKWFNRLYWMMTRNVVHHMSNTAEWKTPYRLPQIIPDFARYYFRTVHQAETDVSACPRAWQPLFERRNDRRVARLQFALAGMNARINRDLPKALRERIGWREL